MTSREHARRLMLILLSSPGGPAPGRTADGQRDERTGDRQAPEGRDDSTDGDERDTEARLEALILT